MEAGNWHPMKLSKVRTEDIITLTEGGGRYLEQEILDYMKYGLFDTDWDELDEAGAGELLEAWKEGRKGKPALRPFTQPIPGKLSG